MVLAAVWGLTGSCAAEGTVRKIGEFVVLEFRNLFKCVEWSRLVNKSVVARFVEDYSKTIKW